MKIKLIESNFDRETGVSYAKIQTDYGVFAGSAKLHEEDKDPLFSIGCQHNISKEYFIWRIHNTDYGLEENPYRQEYLDILERY